MNAVDLVTIGAFVVAAAIGGALPRLPVLANRQARKRIHQHMHDIPLRAGSPRADRAAPGVALLSLERKRGPLLAVFNRQLSHVRAVGGAAGLRLIYASAVCGLVAAIVGVSLLDPPTLVHVLAYVAAPLLGARFGYRFIVARFRTRFLSAFPDAIDLIVRAVRAGVPVVQAINAAGNDADEPVRSTFRVMGDSLLLGADLKDVLTQAAERLQIADFSFFTVYLLLQRETGGSLGETLEALAEIIRTRRDIRLKSRALTAEGRITTKVIAAVPFTVAGFLFLVNRPYIALLFTTGAGHKMLTVAAILLAIGLFTIQRLSKLDTSR